MSYDINSQQVDIENLFKQNELDLCSIKELYKRLDGMEKKISQIKYIDEVLGNKFKKELESLKNLVQNGVGQPEGGQTETINKINEINRRLDNLNNIIDEIESEVGNNTNNITNLNNDITEINSQLNTNTNDIENLRQQIVGSNNSQNHTHSNLNVLEKITEVESKLYFNGLPIEDGSGGTIENNIFKGKVANFLGDSQTEVNYHKTKIYHDWVKEILGLSKVNNYGISGSTIAKGADDNKAMCTRYANMDNNADLICVMGGVNDRWFNCQLGNFGDTNPLTFYGAMETLCDGLLTKYPGKTIIFITPTEQNHSGCNSANTTGYTPTDFANAMKRVCAKYSIPVFDANTCCGIYPLNDANASVYTTDKLHLNDKGHEVLGNKLSKFILNGANVVMINNDNSEGSSGGSSGGNTPETPSETPSENKFVGKTVTVTKNFNDGSFLHLTALLAVEDDMRNNSTYDIVFRGSNVSNMGNATNTGGALFSDNSGEVSNGLYVNQMGMGPTFTQTVSDGNLTITAPSRNAEITTNYVKVPIVISGTTPYSFRIDEIKVIVNDVERNILKLGSFFASDKEIITIE